MIKSYIKKKYLNFGVILGDRLSYSYMGKWVGYDKDIKKFLKLQEKIIKYGYKPICLNQFIGIGGWGEENNLILEKSQNKKEIKEILINNLLILGESENQTQINLANKIFNNNI